jgi:pimeloyl-ACP methyl ester carboxylesterase
MVRPTRGRLDVGAAVLTLADRVRAAALGMHGFRSRQVQTSSGSVRLLSASGTGPIPAVVALHGLASAAVDLGSMLARMRRIAQLVVAPDLPGHGCSLVASDAQCVSAIRTGLSEALERTVGRPTVLFGNSLGGLVAIRHAAANPDRVAALVLASPAGVASSREELHSLLGRFRSDDGAMRAELLRLVLPTGFLLRRSLYAWGVGVRLRQPSIRALLAEIDEVDALRPADLAALRMPVLLLWGEHDRLLPASHLEFFRRHLPRHALIDVVPGMGHALHLEAPDLVADRVLAFWRSIAVR